MTEPRHSQGTEPEFYAEPAKLTRRDAAGVVLALVSLAIIGVSGYVWLNPKLSLSGLLSDGRVQRSTVSSQTVGARRIVATAPQPAAGSGAVEINHEQTTLIAAANGNREAECPHCGMVAGASEAEVVAQFADGTISHFDSWICVFDWSKVKGIKLSAAVAMEHGTHDSPHWLPAKNSAFLFDTKRIPLSMPPYVAAFVDQTAATTAQAELGGQVLDWVGLEAKFEKQQ